MLESLKRKAKKFQKDEMNLKAELFSKALIVFKLVFYAWNEKNEDGYTIQCASGQIKKCRLKNKHHRWTDPRAWVCLVVANTNSTC